MKIFELTRSFYPSIGGMEKFVADRLKIYEALEYDYQVITTTHSEKRISNERLKDVIYLPSYTPYEIVSSLSKVMSKIEYDILSINQVTYYYAFQAAEKAFSMNKKIILTPHFFYHTKRFNFLKKIHSKVFLPQILSKVNKIICFTNYEADFWINYFPWTKEKIVIIPHYFSLSENKFKLMKNNYGKYLLFLGRGEKNKRIDLLLKAFTELETDYNLVLTISKDEINSTLEEIIQKNNNIVMLGKVSESEKYNLLVNSEALILPTDYEAFGIVNFEASYYKKPLILTNLKVFREILNSEGVLYFENNLFSLKNTIQTFFNLSESEKQKMGETNYGNLKNYSFEKIKKKYSYLFRNLGKI